MPKFTIITVKKQVSSIEVTGESLEDIQSRLDKGFFEDEIEEQYNDYREISDTDSYIKGQEQQKPSQKIIAGYVFGSDAIETADRESLNFDEVRHAIEECRAEGATKEITFNSVEEMLAYEQGLADADGWAKTRKEFQVNPKD